MRGATYVCVFLAGTVTLGAVVVACDVGDVGDLRFRDALADATPDAGESTNIGEPGPVPPADPYEAALRIYGDDEACVACVRASCDTEARACADDPACADDARCRAGCNDPVCQYWGCTDRHPHDEQPTYPLEECLIAACSVACRVGQDFDCSGAYSRPSPGTDDPLVIRVQLMHGVGVVEPVREAGIRARVCEPFSTDCANPLVEAYSDDAGLVDIPLPATEPRGAPVSGYVELSDPGRNPPRIVTQLLVMGYTSAGLAELPRRSNQYRLPLGVGYPEDWERQYMVASVQDVAGRGVVLAYVADCRYSIRAYASGVIVDVRPSDAATQVFYAWSLTATATDTTGVAMAANVPPGMATVTAFRDGVEISRVDVPVRANAATGLLMSPARAP